MAPECQRAGEVILFAEEMDRDADDLRKPFVRRSRKRGWKVQKPITGLAGFEALSSGWFSGAR
jgi:hypothetical protein